MVAAAPGTFPTKKPIIKRFQALLSVLTGTSTLLSKSHLLAESILSFTLLENSTFQDPSHYPLLRVSSLDFAAFLSLLPNIRSLKAKSGLLQFDQHCWTLLSPNNPNACGYPRVAPLGKVTEFAVIQERATHRGCVESILSRGVLPSMTSLSWTSFDGLSSDAYAPNLLSSSSTTPSIPAPTLPPIKNALQSLTLDFRATGPSLGLLYTLLHSSIESHSLRALHLPQLPQVLSPTTLRSLRSIEASEHPVSSLSDVIHLLQPSLTTLSLGSQPSDISGLIGRQPAWLGQGGDAFLTSVGNLRDEPLDLSSSAPQLETLICTSYPLQSLLTANVPPTSASSSQPSRSSRSAYAMLGLGAASRLPPNLKALEVRLAESSLQNAGVWSHIVDGVLSALSADADARIAPLRRKGIQRVLLELPSHLLPAVAKQTGGNAIRKKPTMLTAAAGRNTGWQLKKKAVPSDADMLFIERLEVLRVYCASTRVKLELTPCSSLSSI